MPLRICLLTHSHGNVYQCNVHVASDIVILHLTRTCCLPILLYGLESFTVSRSCLNTIEFCWNRAMFKIFNTGCRDNVNYVLYYTGILPLSYQIDLRKLRFLSCEAYNNLVGGTDCIDTRWPSGTVPDWRSRGREFESH